MVRATLLRDRADPGSGRVAFVELFFDLVFVFAVTQLSHHLLHKPTLAGALETLLLFLAVWWVWIFSTWVLNWLDPQRVPVRLMLYALMFGGLVLSMAIPEAFGARGLAFGLALAAMQVGRSLFAVWAMSGQDETRRRNFVRITAWLSASGVFWIAGGLAGPDWRLPLWVLALSIEYAAPVAGFRTPRLGRSETADWNVSGAHMAERCGLFVIIALGETLLLAGATFAGQDWTATGFLAFGAVFAGTVAMWWVYFHLGHERGAHHIEHAADRGRIARGAFTYAHIPIVAGIILSAVASELVLAHPEGHADLPTLACLLGGQALFLLGNLWFKATTLGHPPLSHLGGLVLTAAVVLVHDAVSPLALAALLAAILVVVAVWERLSLDPPAAA